jgi:ABC-type polysaccharide/polyol phosphate transport system ATPase subunit
MSAIIVEALSKRYVLDHEVRHDTFRDALSHGAKGLWSMLRGRSAARRSREEFWALRDVSFSVEPGEVVGIIGRNGAGKSTLLKIVSRITEPTHGRVRLRGRVASLLEVGTGFHPELTGRENIFLNGSILGMHRAEIRAKFDEIVAFAEVERFLDTPVKRYSSGMYVRLAFAVAAHLEPEILIVDEVLAVGDAAFQRKCLGKMQEVSRDRGRTVLFVSHNLKVVEHFCARSCWLEGGRLREEGPTARVVGGYLRQDAGQFAGKASEALNDELDLVSLEFTPPFIQTRDPLGFSVAFTIKRDCEISDLHLFLTNSFSERVTMIDLRDAAAPGGIRRLRGGRTVRFSGRIARVVLVDGTYRVGFTVRTSRHFVTRHDVAEIGISTAPTAAQLMAYAPEYQGTTVLDYDVAVEETT